MKFVVSSTELLARLQSVTRVISSKNSLPILDNFLFILKDSTLSITASDLETTLKTSMTIENVSEEGEITVPAKLLVSGFAFRVSGFAFRVSGFAFRVSGFKVSEF